MTRQRKGGRSLVCALVSAALSFGACAPPATVCPSDAVVFPTPRAGEPEWIAPSFPFVPPEDEGLVQTHLWLPWDYNRQPVYPLNEGESVRMRVRSMIGRGYVADRARVLVFVEGRLTSIRADDGQEGETIEFPLEGNLGQIALEVPASRLTAGFNTIQVVTQHRLDGQWAVVLTSQQLFTALVGEPREREYEETPLEDTSLEFRPGHRTQLEETTPGLMGSVLTAYRRRPPLNPLPVALRLQVGWSQIRDCDEEIRFAVVALLDGRPVPIGEHERILATMRWGEQRTYRFDLDLPQDEGPHRYEMFFLPSLGRPARTSGGGTGPWAAFPRSIAVIQWGPED